MGQIDDSADRNFRLIDTGRLVPTNHPIIFNSFIVNNASLRKSLFILEEATTIICSFLILRLTYIHLMDDRSDNLDSYISYPYL